jgi:hypothetical protein
MGGFIGWKAERDLGAGHCIFQFVSLRGMDCKYYFIEYSFELFYHTIFLVYMLFYFSYLDVASLSYVFLGR